MSAPHALSHSGDGVRRSPLILLALLAALALTVFGGAGAAHAEGGVPDKPKDLIYASEGAEISAPDMDTITSLMGGLNGAHDEKVGVIVSDDGKDAQGLADKALKKWGLSKNGAVIVITTKNQDVAVAVGSGLKKNVPSDAQGDVVNKVKDGIGDYADWASGIQSGATRLFLYIEGQGLSGGTDDHHEGDGHSHAADDPAAEEVPEGQAPDDAYTEDQEGTTAADSESDQAAKTSDTTKIVGGVTIVVLAGAGLFLMYRMARRKKASTDGSDESGSEDDADKE